MTNIKDVLKQYEKVREEKGKKKDKEKEPVKRK